jgi:Ras-related C3 botulinum toxin substrate 1
MKHIICAVGGDGGVGKTCLLLTYTTNEFPGAYVPTMFHNHFANVMVEDQQIKLELWDTAPEDPYSRFGPWFVPSTDVFMICFSLVSPTSLENVQNRWLPEIKKHRPIFPFILVGMKSDLRDQFSQHADEFKSKGWEPVAASKGEDMKKALGAQAYIECSAKIQDNLKEVFEAVIKVVLHLPSAAPAKVEKSGGCCSVA